MKILQITKLDSFADHHRLLCLVVSFCFGLIACVSIAKLDAKQSTHKQLVSPSEFNAIGAVSTAVETGDESEVQRTQNGNSKPVGQDVGHDDSMPCKNSNTPDFEGPVSESLTSLGIRLQI